jgi:AcrR family transcriptional regulator
MADEDERSRPRRPRADAVRNRARLLDAARAELAADPDAGVEEIARRASVGVGTLYRHFATRDELVWAVYSDQVDGLAAAADRFLRDLSPAEALGQWLLELVDYITAKRGMVTALRAVLDNDAPRYDQARATVWDAAGRLLAAAVADGAIRDEVTPPELLRAVGGLCLDTESSAGIERSRRMVTIFFDGLRSMP